METEHCALLIVGAGHAGSELAMAARQGGLAGRIVLLGDEADLPYHRPPLSKAYLLGQSDLAALALRPAKTYADANIEWRAGARATQLDRAARLLTLADGTQFSYDKLALCTGGRPRPWHCEGMDLQRPPTNLAYLRTREDADRIRAQLTPRTRLVVVGGGYVGLEVAASARGLGAQVTVLEAQPRVLARVAGEQVSRFYEDVHRAEGVEVRTGTAIAGVVCEGGRITVVRCRHAEGAFDLPADLVVAGIGMLPNTELAQAAGLADANGIAVDELGRTADPHIVAAGDCTVQWHALYARQLRLESVPNALEQARAAASWLCGRPKPNHSVPWFWSDQYALKLQMAGLSQGFDACVVRGDPAARSFCAFYLQAGRLLAVDAVNRPAEFMQARRALAQPAVLDAARLADEGAPLKELFAPAPSAITGKP